MHFVVVVVMATVVLAVSLFFFSLLRATVSVFAELCVLFVSRPSLPPHVQRQWAQFTELLLLLAHKYASFLDKSGDDARSLEALRLRHALLGNNDNSSREWKGLMRFFLSGFFRRSKELLFAPALKEDCSRPPGKNAASLSLVRCRFRAPVLLLV